MAVTVMFQQHVGSKYKAALAFLPMLLSFSTVVTIHQVSVPSTQVHWGCMHAYCQAINQAINQMVFIWHESILHLVHFKILTQNTLIHALKIIHNRITIPVCAKAYTHTHTHRHTHNSVHTQGLTIIK